MKPEKQSIRALRQLEHQLYAYRYALNVMEYDSETVAPPESTAGRAEAGEVLSRASFELLVNDDTAALLALAADEAQTEQEQAEVREVKRSYEQIRRIPAEEYAAFTRLTQEALPVWVRAKRENNFALFAPYLEKIVDTRKAQAHYIDPDRAPYEVLLDQFERGLTISKCDEFFATLRAAIVPLLAAIEDHGAPVRTDFLRQSWDVQKQKQLSAKIMQLWGLDPDHCALGESEHPFTSGFWRGDVRITTHYQPEDMVSNLYSVAHEGGHALYELHVAPELDYTVLAGGSSMGIHESQSRLFENCVARSAAFVHYLWGELTALFPTQLAGVTEEEFYRAVNRAEPGLIRTEADELTYGLHIMVRYEVEKALLSGSLQVADLPGYWNAKYKEYLGVEVPDDAHGVLQDVHWACGDLGYFPSYALGSAYAAQAMADIAKTRDLQADFAAGALQPLKDELCCRVWRYGCLKEPQWLVKSLCGGDFTPDAYCAYLREKYTALYRL